MIADVVHCEETTCSNLTNGNARFDGKNYCYKEHYSFKTTDGWYWHKPETETDNQKVAVGQKNSGCVIYLFFVIFY